FGAEAWSQFMNIQAPLLNNMMNNYVEQSKNMFVQMQEQMQNQTSNIFGGFPPFNPADKDKDKEDK
ncbi:MAG: PHB accumulation regulatory domain-containing protein, partial [Advenella sp.]